MKTENNLLVANILRYIARYSLLVIGILVFIFALLSGSESFGGGIRGVILNSPNAIPWLLLLILVFVAWKWEFIGGIIITCLGLFLFYFLNLRRPAFNWFPIMLTLMIFIPGCFLIISSLLRKNKDKHTSIQ